MTVFKIIALGPIAQLAISGPLVRGQGALWAMQRDIRRCAASDFSALVINLHDVDEVDDDGAYALQIALHAAGSLGATFQLEGVQPKVEAVLLRHGLL